MHAPVSHDPHLAQSDDCPFLDPLSAPSKPTESSPSPSSNGSPELSSTPAPANAPELEAEKTSPKLPPRPDAPPPSFHTVSPAVAPPSFDGTSDGTGPALAAGAATSSAPAGIKPGRVISEQERVALKVLGEHREQLKAGYESRRTALVRIRQCDVTCDGDSCSLDLVDQLWISGRCRYIQIFCGYREVVLLLTSKYPCMSYAVF